MSRQHDSMIYPQIETLLERESLEKGQIGRAHV